MTCPSIDSVLLHPVLVLLHIVKLPSTCVCDADGAGDHLSQIGMTCPSIDSMLSHVVVVLLLVVKLSLTRRLSVFSGIGVTWCHLRMSQKSPVPSCPAGAASAKACPV